MKDEKQEQKPKRKILVEFELPEKWQGIGPLYFSDYVFQYANGLDEESLAFLKSGKPVSH